MGSSGRRGVRGGRWGWRIGVAATVTGAVAVLLGGPASASASGYGDGDAYADGAVVADAGQAAVFPLSPAPPPGLHGPVVTHPVQEPFDYPAGEVCAFPSHADFPVADLTLKTWTDDAGDPVFAIESGPLLMRTTNLATGRSVVSDISGTGVITYPAPGVSVLSGNDWSAGFHTADHPHNRWIVAHGFMSVRIAPAGGRTSHTLLALHGPADDLCKTLA